MFEDLYEGQPPSRHLEVRWEDRLVYALHPEYDKPQHLGMFDSYVAAQQFADERGIELYSITPIKVQS